MDPDVDFRINIVPEYWIMSEQMAIFLGVTFILVISVSGFSAWCNGYCSKKSRIKALKDREAEFNDQLEAVKMTKKSFFCFKYWIISLAVTFITIFDFISDYLYFK